MAKRKSPGCVNAAGKGRQKWYATAVTKYTKPGDHLLAEPFSSSVVLHFWKTASLNTNIGNEISTIKGKT